VNEVEWSHASLSLEQPGWPGVKRAEWMASTAAGEQFRTHDMLEAMDRLGADGWELVTFAPEFNDRSAIYVFRRRKA
jgi:hypothetical protein